MPPVTLARLVSLPLSAESTKIECREKSIFLIRQGNAELLLESFSNEQKALSAYHQIAALITKHHKNKRRIGIVKSILLWIIYPILLFLGFLALNAALNLPKQAAIIPSANTAHLMPGTRYNNAPVQQQSPVTPDALSQTLQKALNEKIYTVNVSKQDNAPTLYVFSDPALPKLSKV